MKRVKITTEQYIKLGEFLAEAKNPHFDRKIQQNKVAAKQQAGVEKQQANNNKTTKPKPVDLKPVDTTPSQIKADKMNQTLSSLSVKDTFQIISGNKRYNGTISRKDETGTFVDLLDTETQKWSINLEVPNNPFRAYKDDVGMIIKLPSGQIQALKAIQSFNPDAVSKPKVNPPTEPTNTPRPTQTTTQPDNSSTPDNQPAPEASNDEESDEEKGESIYKTILSDPNLRDAFWKQPKLLNMIKLGNPVGIGPAQELINKYTGGVGFKTNKRVEIEIYQGDGGVLINGETYEGVTQLGVNDKKYINLHINKRRYVLLITNEENGFMLAKLKQSGVKDIISNNIQFKFIG